MDQDIFSLTRAHQFAAMLDLSTDTLRTGTPVPRGWHNAMFAVPTPQSQLRPDGYGDLGIALPKTDLPRLMFGGRRVQFHGDILIGAPAHRTSHLVSSVEKHGRSGRMLIVTIRREITCEADEPVVVEEQDYLLREAAIPAQPSTPPQPRPADISQEFTATEMLLLRYCALTFNTHRIHYDHPYATTVEGYPALVINGNLATLKLTEMFRSQTGRAPKSLTTRNARPLFCGHANRLHAKPSDAGWNLWITDPSGHIALEAEIA
jgi:3-methylfumaryl-CoA hydratase